MSVYDKFDYAYFAGEHIITPNMDNGKSLVSDNGTRLIPENIKKLVFRTTTTYDRYTHMIPMMINNMSVIPDSVINLTIISKFTSLHVMPKNIKIVYFHDYDSIVESIPNMILWPDIDHYMFYHKTRYINISNIIRSIKCIHEILPQPIYEEIIDHINIKYSFLV